MSATNYEQQYKSLLANVKSFIQDANYNGKTLIGDLIGRQPARLRHRLRSRRTKTARPTARSVQRFARSMARISYHYRRQLHWHAAAMVSC